MKSTVPSRRVTLLKRNSRYLAAGGKWQEVDKRKRSVSHSGEALDISESEYFNFMSWIGWIMDKKKKHLLLDCTEFTFTL